MILKQLTGALLLSGLSGACTYKKADTLVFPAAVLAAHQERQYKTALWCVYTSHLDSFVLKRGIKEGVPADSVRAALRQLLSVKRHLERTEKAGRSTCFRFHFDFPVVLLNKIDFYQERHPSGNLMPLSAVWVDNKDGLIDSVLTGDGIIFSAVPEMKQIQGKWTISGPPNKRAMSYNANQPFKGAFLRENEKWLNPDLRQLCEEKNILAH